MNATASGDLSLLPAHAPLQAPEDRRHRRFAVKLPAIKINDLGETWQGFFAPVLNVSQRGFCLRIPFLPAMGNSFNFEWVLPDGTHVTGTAQCRWTKSEAGGWLSWTCGAEIIGLNPVQAAHWDAYIASLEHGASTA